MSAGLAVYNLMEDVYKKKLLTNVQPDGTWDLSMARRQPQKGPQENEEKGIC